MRVIILGGTALGRLVADSLPSSLLVEPSLEKASDLAQRYGADRVMVGDPGQERTLLRAGVEEAETVIVAMGDDALNLTIAKKVKELSRCRIIVEASDPTNVQVLNDLGFEDVISPAISAAQQVLGLVRPEAHQVSQLYVTEGSPLKGKKLGELLLPKGVMVAGVLRQDRLVKPEQADTLSKGDHLVLFSSSGPAPIEALVADSRFEMRPFAEIALLLDDSQASVAMAREMASLAKDVRCRLKLASSSELALRAAEEVVLAWKVPYTIALLETGALVDPKGTAQSLGLEGGCLALPMGDRLGKGVFARRRIKDLIASTPSPIIVSRGTYPYRSLLALVDVTWKDGKVAETAARLAIVGKAELDLLRDVESVEAAEEARHLRRLARSYGVQVRDIAIEGNPTVELVSMIKSGRYDLVALDWGCKMLKKDIFQRIVFESPVSVLVKGQAVCELPFRP